MNIVPFIARIIIGSSLSPPGIATNTGLRLLSGVLCRCGRSICCFCGRIKTYVQNFSDFSCRLLIPVIKFCIIIISMMLMTVIGVVPLYWLNWSLYATGCQISVFLMVACLHTTMCVTWFRISRCRNFFITLFALSSCTMYVLYDRL